MLSMLALASSQKNTFNYCSTPHLPTMENASVVPQVGNPCDLGDENQSKLSRSDIQQVVCFCPCLYLECSPSDQWVWKNKNLRMLRWRDWVQVKADEIECKWQEPSSAFCLQLQSTRKTYDEREKKKSQNSALLPIHPHELTHILTHLNSHWNWAALLGITNVFHVTSTTPALTQPVSNRQISLTFIPVFEVASLT